MNKEELYAKGLSLLKAFCKMNNIGEPPVIRLFKDSDNKLHVRYYYIGTCAFYHERERQIYIGVDRCALPGMGGRAWSWPGYAIDRTPYGVLQHELGHYVDALKSNTMMLREVTKSGLFSYDIWQQSQEDPMTNYLGTDNNSQTFYKEWFAENFRVFVTNPGLSKVLRPKFFHAMRVVGFIPVQYMDWDEKLQLLKATPRIMDQTRKKIQKVGALLI